MHTEILPSRYPAGPLLREPADLDVPDLASEEVVHISTARVVVADYDVLQHDFPELQTDSLLRLYPELLDLARAEQETAVRSILDRWLIANGAFVSTSQAAQAVVNTPIAVDDVRRVAYRPPNYGRAVVVPTCSDKFFDGSPVDGPRFAPGLLDLKGAGVSPERVPVNGHQSSGLEYLAVALSDFLLKKVIDEIFGRTLPEAWTVPVYAVLDLGFDACDGFHGTGPAGMHVRRAHRRPLPDLFGDIDYELPTAIENALRRYGITTATRGSQRHLSFEMGQVLTRIGDNTAYPLRRPESVGIALSLLTRANPLTLDRPIVQLSRAMKNPDYRAQMVDFGHIRIEPQFDCPLQRTFDASTLKNVLWPDSPEFIQPDPEVCLPIDRWKRIVLVSWCVDLVRAFRNQEVSREEVDHAIDELLKPLAAAWSMERVAATNPIGA